MCSSSEVGKASDKLSPDIIEQAKAYVKRRDSNNPNAAKIRVYLHGNDSIKDISPQFVENVNNVLEKYENNTFVLYTLSNMVSEFLY